MWKEVEKVEEKKVFITVNTVQSFGEETEEIELASEGTICRKEDHYLVEYDESEISGMKGTKTSIEIYDDSVSLIRNGTTNSHLVFKSGSEHVSLYGTEHGAFEVIVRPRRVNIKVNENGGAVELDYIIETQGINVSDNKLVLTINATK